ncbi:MAG TPA: sigma-70 family RNA polymerase sigma factor [Chitinophagaceae bacterium]|jgi:RNA polymerase sigma-70 factor (ECF subfamily)
MYAGAGDNEIISKVLQGDQQFFAELVNRYRHFVFTIALRYTVNREDAEEIAQDVFVKAYRSLADFRRDSKFSTWLYAITTNTCITFLRKRKIVTYSLDNEKIFEFANSTGVINGKEAEHKSKAGLMNKAIRLLNADDATIITLFYKGEQSLEEIGQIMGITSNTAKVKLHRARRRLKEKLETHFAGELKNILD